MVSRIYRSVLFCLIAFLSGCSTVFAVDTLSVAPAEAILDDWRWTTFDASVGLKGNVSDVFEDRDGNIWFATDRGAHRYDGLRWTTFTADDGLASDEVVTAIQDRDGAMWFATEEDGISRLVIDPATGAQQWTTFTVDDGLASNAFLGHSLAQSRDGTLWAGSWDINAENQRGGISRFDGRTWEKVEMTEGSAWPAVFSVFARKDGSVWFTTANDGVYRFDGRIWRRFSEADGLAPGTISHVYEDAHGRIWLAHVQSGMSRFDGMSWRKWTSDEIPSSVMFWEDWKGHLWAGGQNGLARIEGDSVRVFGSSDLPHLGGLIMGRVVADGSIWLWSFRRPGAFRFVQDGPEVYACSDSLFVGPEGLDGSVWFGTHDRAVRYKEGVWLGYGSEDGFLNGGVQILSRSKHGDIWALGWHNGRGAVARFAGEDWRVYTADDGVIDSPGSMLMAPSGDVWVTGKHEGGPGLSWLQKEALRWERFTAADGLPGERIGVAYEASDGTVWFGVGIDSTSNLGKGLLRFDPSEKDQTRRWMHFTEEADSLSGGLIVDMAEWPRGTLWMGAGNGLHRIALADLPEKKTWRHWDRQVFDVNLPKFQSLTPTADGLWFHPYFPRFKGAFYFDGTAWKHLMKKDGLPDDGIHEIIMAGDGSLWFAARSGLARYDDKTWERFGQADGLPPLRLSRLHEIITEVRDGSFWIPAGEKEVVHFRYFERTEPETFLEPTIDQVSAAGNILIRWAGAVKWNRTPSQDLTYAWRMDGSDWRMTHRTDVTFTALSAGDHRFEVRAIDPNGKVDASPVIHAFMVDLVWWRNPWFIGLVVIFIGVTTVQGMRVVRGTRALRESNAALSSANHELVGLNRQLQRDRSVERVRGHVQSMAAAEDFETVLSELTADLKAVGLAFDTCEIDVLDEPVSQPTMAFFEQNGFRYTTYRLDPDASVTFDTYRLSAPFPTVIRETIERFVAGESWQAHVEGASTMVEVAAGSYGRLRLSTRKHGQYTEDEVLTLQEFANAIALGYARYLDIREIQTQTERKSAFLARMSHELRTPMNAIKGFANLVRRRETGLSHRGQENLEKVNQASDHLLAMINDLLDLSKIEAGHMDVNPQPFDVKALVASCCATVSPLLADRPDVTLEHDVNEDIGQANTDEGRLRQMLINLLSNAIKFTDKGRVYVHATRKNAHLVLSVSDTGKGIPEAELPTIFDEYHQVKGSDSVVQKGTGLGLSITRKFAELLGGTICATSEMGTGSTFTIRIPATCEDAASS